MIYFKYKLRDEDSILGSEFVKNLKNSNVGVKDLKNKVKYLNELNSDYVGFLKNFVNTSNFDKYCAMNKFYDIDLTNINYNNIGSRRDLSGEDIAKLCQGDPKMLGIIVDDISFKQVVSDYVLYFEPLVKRCATNLFKEIQEKQNENQVM